MKNKSFTEADRFLQITTARLLAIVGFMLKKASKFDTQCSTGKFDNYAFFPL